MIAGTDETGAFIREKYKPACGSPFSAVSRNEVPGYSWTCSRRKDLAAWARSLKIHNRTARSRRRTSEVVARMEVGRRMVNGGNRRRCKRMRASWEDDIIEKLRVSVKMEPARRRKTGLGASLDCQACSLEGLVSGNVLCCKGSERTQGKGGVIECPRRPLGLHQRHSDRPLSSLHRWRAQSLHRQQGRDRSGVRRFSA